MKISDYTAAPQFQAGRVARYAEAELRLPDARLSELVFARAAVGSAANDVMLDVSAGIGFLWSVFRKRFHRAVLLDESPDMLDQARRRFVPDERGPTVEFKTLPMQDVRPGSVPECDFLGCHASFHHLVVKAVADATSGLPAAWQYDVDQTRVLHKNTVAGWFGTLRPGGALFIADVAPQSLEEGSKPRLDTRWPRRPVGDWFDDVVHTEGLMPHLRHYTATVEIRECLEDLGAEIVADAVLATPWVFDTAADAVWFVNEMFSLTPEAVPFEKRYDIAGSLANTARLVEEHLGLNFVNGKAHLGWALWGIVARKPETRGL